jgi:hypothetical protein
MKYGFGELMDDLGPWFLLGVILAGILGAVLPPGFIGEHLGTGLGSLLAALAVSLPLYVCATASTPLAAALAAAGLSPGAALVLLLAGPATNIASLTVVARLLGLRALVGYVAAIVLVTLGLGAATNWLYASLGLTLDAWIAGDAVESHGAVSIASAAVVFFLCLRSVFRRF